MVTAETELKTVKERLSMARSRSIAAILTIVVFFGALAVFGSIALFITAEGAYYGYASRFWPSTDGIIDASQIMTVAEDNGQKKHRLMIAYHYDVDGVRYLNNKTQFLDNVFLQKTKKDEIVAIFRTGQKARVTYNPSDPQTSVLIPGFPIGTFLGGLFLGLLFLGLGVWGIVLLRK